MILGVEDIILVIDIIVIALVVLVSFYRLIKWAFIGTYITLVPEGTIQIVSGCKIQIEARIKQRPKCNFRLDWQKVGNNNEARNISFCETVKYSGTEIKSLAPVLLINKAEKDDAGLYQLRYESSTEVVISRQIAVHVFGGKL
ncbi:Hypothetical predicted protein [Mytilus galloprovincialis]|uniref:Immunoglobulin subtype domain-containing protein n=1 Tax=Mytilus galloprovincialis TaxID=29158 RepID=A0A8B6HHZ9_MYTGA|nr:Hypothetical predicted protein [Mytilus galloprovincialis]